MSPEKKDESNSTKIWIAVISGLFLVVAAALGGPVLQRFLDIYYPVTTPTITVTAIVQNTNNSLPPTDTPVPEEKFKDGETAHDLTYTATPAPQPEIVLSDGFNNSNSNYDTSVWECNGDNCEQNIFLEDGMLSLKINDPIEGTTLGSRQTWKANGIVSLEGKLQCGTSSKGAVWIALGDVADCGILFADAPVFGCSVGKGNEKEYETEHFSVKCGTWYKEKIVFDPTTNKIEFYLDDNLIDSYEASNPQGMVSATLGVWRAEESPQSQGYFDDIVLRINP